MKHANVLITGVGSILGQGIIKSLKLSNIQNTSPITYRIFAADMSQQAAGIYRCDRSFLIPSPTEKEYGDQVIKICKENRIDAIFVGTDEEITILADLKDQIEKESGAIVITNPKSVIRIASDKWLTYKQLVKNNIPCARSVLPEDSDELVREFGFPIVAKPRQGHGSLHFYIVHNNGELRRTVSVMEACGLEPILQECLGGTDNEFTSGITIDSTGSVMSSIAMRKTIKNGQTYKAFIDNFDSIRTSSEKAAVKIGARGPVNVQAKEVNGETRVFEINARFSATCPLRAVAGINEPDIVFRNFVLGEKIRADSYQRLMCMRYWNEVYVPISTYNVMTEAKTIQEPNSVIPNYF